VNDNTPVYDVLFQMQMSLCNRFMSLTPLDLRKEKAREVFILFSRYIRYSKNEKKKNTLNGKKIIRRPASDNWF
jgi:hypothetical protein